MFINRNKESEFNSFGTQTYSAWIELIEAKEDLEAMVQKAEQQRIAIQLYPDGELKDKEEIRFIVSQKKIVEKINSYNESVKKYNHFYQLEKDTIPEDWGFCEISSYQVVEESIKNFYTTRS